MCVSLDGRFHGSIASKDLVDCSEHSGSLYWLVKRSSDKENANMDFETFTWEGHVQLRLPWKKAGDHIEFRPENLSSVPLLMNKKAIQAHERLVVFFEPSTKEEKEEQKGDNKKAKVGVKD